jgi:hypothetical protein
MKQFLLLSEGVLQYVGKIILMPVLGISKCVTVFVHNQVLER